MFRIGHWVVFLIACAAFASAGAEDKKEDNKVEKKAEKKGEFKLTESEQTVIELTNAERKKAEKKLTALKMNPKLMEAARKHAANMAAQEKMEHELDGKNPADRADAAGYKYRSLGENVAFGQETPKKVVEVWMNSPPHRENILGSGYTEIGVGVVKGKDGHLYWCQVFGRQ
jgi:uncharacterized protein YkwD